MTIFYFCDLIELLKKKYYYINIGDNMNIAEKILDNMPLDLNDLEKARYIYIELCKKVFFSTQFLNSDDNTFCELLGKKVDVTSLSNEEINVNCRIWSQLYSQLLSFVGINNNIIDGLHEFVEFYIDGEIWIADATFGAYTDLSKIQNNDDTACFGPALFQTGDSNIVDMSEETETMLFEIDKKLGYNTRDRENLMEFKTLLEQIKDGSIDIRSFSHIGEINNDNELCFKLEFLFSKLGVLKSGYYESKDFVFSLERLMLTDNEKNKMGAVELKRTNKDKTVDIVQCIYVLNGNKWQYYLLAPNLPVRRFDSKQITKLAIMGFGIEDKKIPGIIYPRNFTPGKVDFSIKHSLHRKMSNLKLINIDDIIEYDDTYIR